MNKILGVGILIGIIIYIIYLVSDKRKFSEMSSLSRLFKIRIMVMLLFFLIIGILLVVGKAKIM